MSLEQRIRIFKSIRNLPYRIPLSADDSAQNCVTKCMELEKSLKEIGLLVRSVLCTFSWDETRLPAHILALPRDHDETHLYLQVKVPENPAWVDVDPSWDPQLAMLGFDVPEWDGLHGTSLAVKPHRILPDDEAKALLEKYNDPDIVKQHFDKHRQFYAAINEWLASARSL